MITRFCAKLEDRRGFPAVPNHNTVRFFPLARSCGFIVVLFGSRCSNAPLIPGMHLYTWYQVYGNGAVWFRQDRNRTVGKRFRLFRFYLQIVRESRGVHQLFFGVI